MRWIGAAAVLAAVSVACGCRDTQRAEIVATAAPAAAAGSVLQGARADQASARDAVASTATEKQEPLFVYCGAAIRKPIEEIAAAFEEQTGVPVRATYTGSGCLLAQIEMVDEGDIYIPGEDYYMDQAVERGKIEDWGLAAYFVPVIMVQRGNPHGIETIQDLMRPEIRVGVGEPKSCAIGSFSVKLVEMFGIPWEEFDAKVVAHFATAPELGNAVKLNAVDACIQWNSIAVLYSDDCGIVPLPLSEETVSRIQVGILKSTKRPQAARRFLEFAAGPSGQAIFAKHSFTLSLDDPIFGGA